jgi:hypothetical protein
MKAILVGLMFLYSFVPDTISRISFWVEVIPHARDIPQLLASNIGRLVVLLVGFGIMYFDLRRLPQQPQESSNEHLAISFVQCWVQDDIFYVQLQNNGEAEGVIKDTTAEVTYYDSNKVPYCVIDGIWEETGGSVLQVWRKGTLMVAATTDRKKFFTANDPPHQLQQGKGFLAIRSHSTLYGSQSLLPPPLYFAVNFCKHPSIEKVSNFTV